MYCTQQMILGENYHDWLKNRPQKFSPLKHLLCMVFIYQPAHVVDFIVLDLSLFSYIRMSCVCPHDHVLQSTDRDIFQALLRMTFANPQQTCRSKYSCTFCYLFHASI